MANKEMEIVKLGSSEREQIIYEEQDSVNVNATAGVSIIIPAGVNSIGVSVKVGTGATVKVQASTDKIAAIKSDSADNTWIDWVLGEIIADDQIELCPGASAVRLYCVTAGSTTSTIKVSAK